MALILDIETMEWFKNEEHKDSIVKLRQDKRLSDPTKIAENHQKIIKECALYPMSGQITIVGFYHTGTGERRVVVNGFNDEVDSEVFTCADEKSLLEKSWEIIKGAFDDGERLVTFRGKDFDIPYMFVRSLYYGINAGINYNHLIHPYTHDLHLDLKSLFEQGSLKDITRFLDISTDNETDGSELPDLWKINPAKVIEKCKSDLVRTANLYERVKEWIPQRLQMS